MKLIMVDGANLGELKVMRKVRLIDIYDTLMAALGGSLGYKYEPRLVSPGEVVIDGAYQSPFKNELQDTAYLDRDRRRRE